MTLKAKLIGLTLLAMSVIGLMAGMIVDMARTSSSTISHVFNEEMVPALALGAIDTSLRRIHNRILGTLTDYYPVEGSRLALAESKETIQANWNLIKKARLDAEERERIRRIEEYLPRLWDFIAELDKVYRQEDLVALKALQDARWTEIHINLIKPIQYLHPHFAAHAAAAAKSGIEEGRKHEQWAIVAAVSGTMLMLPLLAWITLRINAGVKTLQEGLDRLARNQYREDVPVTSNDEVGVMASALNRTAAQLRADREEILALKNRNELILDTMGEGLYGTDARGIITFINPAGAAMTGWSAPELIGRPAHATLHHTRPDGTHYPREECPMYSTCQDGKVHQADNDVFWRRDGTPIDIHLVSTPILEEGRVTGAVVVFSDISLRKEAERVIGETMKELRKTNKKLEEAQNQLLQSEKMATIGQLAAGVAHEINNPIGYVHSNLGSLDMYIQSLLGVVAAYEYAESAIADVEVLSQVLAAKRGADLEFLRKDIAALMAESREGITRVKKIVQDLKDFSHVDEAEWQWTDLRKGLDSTLNIVWNEIKYKAEVIKEYGELPEVECLPSQLNQVFMNMLVNAAHAIEPPATSPEGKERGTITLRCGAEGEEVWVEIADTGKGIPPENLNRVFDPFFTTKPVGKGTGLGLSLSYSIVQKHHGRISVASEAGKGTTFRIWLPIKQPEKKE
ncbi:MAG: ATP-binding protein [Sulfuricella sp.]